MLGFGLAALTAGLVVLTRRGGSEQAVYARRIGGMMITAAGFALTVFSIGLARAG
ncbi:MAG: hypothetical protein ABL926_11610 [Novosphingobium sp.]|uniref:hypothetical protein n=1 Tax=Novosphingobium sp. TaxID=1874826 RepID=UPI0032B776C0